MHRKLHLFGRLSGVAVEMRITMPVVAVEKNEEVMLNSVLGSISTQTKGLATQK